MTVHGIGVAVIYEDSPEELVRSADYGLEGVSEVEVFLESLAAAGLGPVTGHHGPSPLDVHKVPLGKLHTSYRLCESSHCPSMRSCAGSRSCFGILSAL